MNNTKKRLFDFILGVFLCVLIIGFTGNNVKAQKCSIGKYMTVDIDSDKWIIFSRDKSKWDDLLVGTGISKDVLKEMFDKHLYIYSCFLYDEEEQIATMAIYRFFFPIGNESWNVESKQNDEHIKEFLKEALFGKEANIDIVTYNGYRYGHYYVLNGDYYEQVYTTASNGYLYYFHFTSKVPLAEFDAETQQITSVFETVNISKDLGFGDLLKRYLVGIVFIIIIIGLLLFSLNKKMKKNVKEDLD